MCISFFLIALNLSRIVRSSVALHPSFSHSLSLLFVIFFTTHTYYVERE